MVFLTEFEARKILKGYALPLPKAHLAKDRDEAELFAEKIGYPVVLKIMSRDILHKTNAGAVKVAKDSGGLKEAYAEIIGNAKKYNPRARIDGVLVEEFVSGTELIVGSKKDAQFGHVIVFGLGGVFVELMHDTAIRLVPITRKDASEMIREIKGHKVLLGYRGRKPVNMKSVEDALLAVSKLVSEHSEIREMDINPLFADENGVVVGDARITM